MKNQSNYSRHQWTMGSQHPGGEQPEQRIASSMIYLKAFSVGIACILILIFPVFYVLLLNTPGTVVPVAQQLAWTHIHADKKQVVKLADGSLVTLLKGSRLSYPANFNLADRKVVSSGTAYFQVKHDAAKPFRIETPTAVITDLGTAFLLRSSDAVQEIVVTEGKAELASRLNRARAIEVLPGQTGILKGDRLLRKKTEETNFLAPLTGKLVFINAPMEQVAADISRYYGTRVQVQPALLRKKVTFTATFRNNTIEEVFSNLEKMGLTVKKQGNGYTIGRRNIVQRILHNMK